MKLGHNFQITGIKPGKCEFLGQSVVGKMNVLSSTTYLWKSLEMFYYYYL
jgi:hypothetical protein